MNHTDDIQTNDTGASLQDHQQALYTLLREFDRVCRALEIPYFLYAGSLLGAVRHQAIIPWDDDLDVMMLREDYERFLREADGILDREKFFLQKEFSDHWPMFFSKLRLNNTACLEKYHPRDLKCHLGVYMDIFPCDNACESALGWKMQFACSKVVIAKSLYARGYDTDSRKKKLVMQLCRLLPQAPFRKFCQYRRGSGSGRVHCFLGAASSMEKSVFPRAWFRDSVALPLGDRAYPAPVEYGKLLTVLYGDYMRIPEESERRCKVHTFLVDLNRSYTAYEDCWDQVVFTDFTRSIR